jgi:uncharacterized NAD(P)/FAD-binding protein YdhS
VIVGGGYSGVAAAVLLARRSREPLELLLVDPAGSPGPGLAHATPIGVHRLNGPASIHAPYPDEPGHFAEWMIRSGTLARDPDAVGPEKRVFARRRDFGLYLNGEFVRHASDNPSSSRIEHVRARALRLVPRAEGIAVELDRGAPLLARHCVLATGWNRIGIPAVLRGIADAPGWLADPWDAPSLGTIRATDRVLLVGAGLTASDTFAALAEQGHAAPVLALSRHGLRPASQNPFRPTDPLWGRLLDPEPAFVRRHGLPRTVGALLRALRADIATVDPATESWHGRFDDLRDAAHLYWPALAPVERRRFVRHLKSLYDAHRFRNPPQVERILERGLAGGHLGYATGRLVGARGRGTDLEVTFLDRADGRTRVERFDAVINCTGPQPRPSASDNPLWRTALADGLVRDDPSGVGIEVDLTGRPIGAGGRVDGRLFALGPPTAGSLGETTAVPYISRRILHLIDALGLA